MTSTLDPAGTGWIRSSAADKLLRQLPPPAPIPGKSPRRPRFGLGARPARTVKTAGSVRVSLPAPAPLPAGQAWAGRWRRVLHRLAHTESPVIWRLAAHAAVLVLTVGVAVTPFLSSDAVTAAEQPGEFVTSDWAERARAFVPDSMVGENADTVAAVEFHPGFVSPGASVEAKVSLLPWNKPERYVVEGGDSLSTIAERFGIEAIWLMYTNPSLRQTPFRLSPGMELNILPNKAVVHEVKEGDTVEELARKYRSEPAKIVGFKANGLDTGGLRPGMALVIPDGEMDIKLPEPPKPAVVSRRGFAAPAPAGSTVGSGQFYVGAYGRLTQGLGRWHHGVDIANRTGTPIYAVDSGTVIYAGWHVWMGRGIIIDHGNGYQSWYAHLSGINIGYGQAVQRGQVIGAMGCSYGPQGRCTGPHLHLEVHYGGRIVNPCSLGACP